jgi:pimeloyl-ACP methyl ester carboxylesterase
MSVSSDGPEATGDFTPGIAEIPAGRIHYREAGSGDPLVFVHGWAVNGTLWDETARELSRSHRCIVVDWPFGSHPEPLAPEADLSPPGAARIVADTLAALDLQNVTLIGNDSGGAISQIVVTQHPERVSRLVLTNCDCLEEFPPGRFKLLVKALRVPGVWNVLSAGFAFRAMQRSPLAYGALTRDEISDGVLDSWVLPARRNGLVRRDSGKFAGGMDPKHTLEAAGKLGRVDIPVLLTWGDADTFFRYELAERLERIIPDAKLVRFPEAKTFLPLDEPKRLAGEIEAFVTERDSVAAG